MPNSIRLAFALGQLDSTRICKILIRTHPYEIHAYSGTQWAQIWHGDCFQPERGQDDSGDMNYCKPGQRRALFLVAKLRK